ncbi:GAF domain-containing protein [Caldimonas tepidiphila]|uniref:GAF domain-containing protein n=1 Tax=Caldimonas tepidiphila TaxID=2315841 RepID=UPI000E5BD48D|nr:GAF domain-containing protein [Caldimonas tepidiphila]
MDTPLSPPQNRAAAIRPAAREPRLPTRLAGLRTSALLEIAAFLAVALLLDRGIGSGHRLAEISPHPFWIPVLLASCYYGTHEGLAAAALAGAALLLGALPEQRLDEDLYSWLLRATLPVIVWSVAALVLGGIRDRLRRRHEALQRQYDEAQEQLSAIADAYAQLDRANQHLEARVAGQLCTVQAMYEAARAIERQDVGDVLCGVSDLVRTVLSPGKFSLFLLHEGRLEAVAQEGWREDDPFAREFESASPIFENLVGRQEVLVISNPAHEALLGCEGLLAGPLVNRDTGEVVGMLKIEQIGFLELHSSGVQNFRLLCEWIGAALAKAQHLERSEQARAVLPREGQQPLPPWEQVRPTLQALARRLNLDFCVLHLALDGMADSSGAMRRILRLARQLLGAEMLAFVPRDEDWHAAVLLPGMTPGQAALVVRQFEQRLLQEAVGTAPPGSIRHRIAPLLSSRTPC